MWDVHTYGNDWVSMPRPIAHGPSLGPGGPIPDFWVVWEGHPIAHTHLATVPNAVAERGKSVCLGPTRTSENLLI